MKIKTFGLAVAMALTLTALAGASSASAANFFAPNGGATTWSGAREGANHVLTFSGFAIGCSNVSFTGSTEEGEPEPASLTVTPELNGCTFLGQPATFEINGCKYRFNFGSSTMDIVGCKSPIRHASAGCETTIGNQEGLGPVTYSESTEGGLPVITATANVSNMTYTKQGGCSGGTGTFKSGAYKGTWKIKGEKLPVSITGVVAPEKATGVFDIAGNGGIGCKSHTLTAQTSVAKFASMTVSPSYSGCTFLGQPTTLNTGGCSYVLHASGGFDIAGSLCASKPITFSIAGGNCTVTIGPKSGGSGLLYTNGGSGASSTVTTGGKTTGLTATVSGPVCITTGTLNANYKSIDVFSASGGLSAE